MYDRLGCILPQELVDAIIDEIPTEETQTLQACTVVSQSFHERAHRRLFSCISLRSSRYAHHREQFDPYARFVQYIARAPHDAALVTELRLHDFHLPPSHAGPGSWLAHDDTLVPTILRPGTLPNLRSLVVNCLDTALSRTIMASIHTLIKAPRLTDVALNKVLFRPDSRSLLSLFAGCGSPKRIAIHGSVTYYGDIDQHPHHHHHHHHHLVQNVHQNQIQPQPLAPVKSPIDALNLKMAPAAATDFVDCLTSTRCPLDLGTLKRLEVSAHWMVHSTIYNRLLREVNGPERLQELVVHTSNSSSRALELGDIPRMECHLLAYCESPAPFVALAKIFERGHRLEELVVRLRLQPPPTPTPMSYTSSSSPSSSRPSSSSPSAISRNPAPTSPSTTSGINTNSNSHWGALDMRGVDAVDAILASVTRRVCLHVEVPNSHSNSNTDVVRRLRERLGQTRGKLGGGFVVEVSSVRLS